MLQPMLSSKRYAILAGIPALGVLLTASAFANVSLKNGNFFIGYTDLAYPGGIEPKVERVYNSKSSYNGIFGFGWGSDYEAYLKVSADGSVIAYENGGGAQNRFSPPAINMAEIEQGVNAILEAKRKIGGLSGTSMEAEKSRLKTDARYRNDEWARLFERGLVQPRSVAIGTELKSNKFSFQTIKRTKDGYLRSFDSGQVQTFDDKGHLTRWTDKNGNFIALGYDKIGNLAWLQDNFNRRVTFTVNGRGKVEKVTGEKGKEAVYAYNGDELVSSKDTDGNVYAYRYSTNGRHNLVEIKYNDAAPGHEATTLQLGYHDLSKCENVKWVKDRDGTLTQYDYAGECNGGMEHTTTTLTKGADGKEISKAKYSYFEKSRADGERYTYKLAAEVDGDRTETVYSECCGLPIQITRNEMTTTFEYDKMGHVTKKATPYEVTELSYDPRANKVSKVMKYSKTGKAKKGVTWAQYEYDSKANLVAAKSSSGKSVKLVYDHVGRIKAMVDQDKRKLEFTYNEASRPIEIRDPALGVIKVEYSNTGEIRKVDSPGGRKIATQVTSAFQNLLDIIRPAGVSLSF
ncbi:MAG: RHS repeat protein [Deltaproteobacteria bacterium]|nr:RHS repeat protein [Deltaproteobacteria bacterium]